VGRSAPSREDARSAVFGCVGFGRTFRERVRDHRGRVVFRKDSLSTRYGVGLYLMRVTTP
jgi:hypothetical protein